MNREKVKNAHPSFVNVISELSTDEARLVRYFSSEGILPKLDLMMVATVGGGEQILYQNFTLFGNKASLDYKELVPQYLNNLKRLGLISYSESSGIGESYTKKEHYEELKNDPMLKALESSVGNSYQARIEEGIVKVTLFGRMFMEAVL
jgi:hypothetical protein